jgi:hypothetical protein
LPCQWNVKNPTGKKSPQRNPTGQKKTWKIPLGKMVKTSPSSIFDVYFFAAASIAIYYDIYFSNNFVPKA